MSEQLCRLLILDDCLEDRTVVRLLLEQVPGREWHIIEEQKATSAFHLLENFQIDCILLDYQLPDMNGVRFLQELTRRFGELSYPVVMFTGSGRASVAVEAMKAGAQDYLSKDILNIDTVVRAIDNAIYRVGLLREREQQRRELEASNARLRLLEAAVHASGEPVVITDAGLGEEGPQIVFVNPAFLQMTGYSAEEILGNTLRVLQGPQADRAFLESTRARLNGGRFTGEAISFRKDGSEFILELDVAPILGRDGRPENYIAIERDVSERFHLRESQQNREPKFQAEPTGSNIDSARAGARAEHLTTEPLALDELVNSVVSFYQDEISATGAVVELEPLPVIEANRALMLQLFQILIGNGLRPRQGGGPPRIRIGAEQQDGFWTVKVSDNGTEVDSAGSEKTLDVFTGWTGEQAGSVWAKSTAAGGSMFSLRVPVREHALAAGGSQTI